MHFGIVVIIKKMSFKRQSTMEKVQKQVVDEVLAEDLALTTSMFLEQLKKQL
ncbi:hypothetical protein KHA80_00835 [Anaerobacillus sp. HL2]|nr:hypothetical protein KHA80_00835 [Anaerobacillus sp. HL2]